MGLARHQELVGQRVPGTHGETTPTVQVRQPVPGVGSHREVVVDHRHLAVELEVAVGLVGLEGVQQGVEEFDELHPENRERLVPLPVPMGVGNDVDGGHLGRLELPSGGRFWHHRVVRVAFGTDLANPVTAAVVAALEASGHEVVQDLTSTWPEVGRRVGEAVAGGSADAGVVCCWTGTGVSIAANKVPGVRAALCVDAETARGARRWNDANVLALSLRLSSEAVAVEVAEAFFATVDVDPDERPNIDRVEG